MFTTKKIRLAQVALIAFQAPSAMAQPAMNCVAPKQNSNGAWEIFNNCPYVVSATWCVVGYDCKAGVDIYSSTWNIGPGKSYPVSQSRGRKIEFSACKGRNINIRGVANEQFECNE